MNESSFAEPKGIRSSISLSDGTKLLNSENIFVLSQSSHSRGSFIVSQILSDIRQKSGGQEVHRRGGAVKLKYTIFHFYSHVLMTVEMTFH